MRINSENLKGFAAAARLQSISNAAKEVHITQSALSQRIQQLEEGLGLTLFERRPRGVALTEAGQELLRYCIEYEQHEAELLSRLAGAQEGGLAGVIRIAGFSTVLRSVLIPALAPLLNQHADIQVHFIGEEFRNLPALLFSGSVDYVAFPEPIEKVGVVSQHLGDEVYVLIRRAHGETPDIYLDNDPEDNTTEQFWRLQKKRPAQLRRRFLDEIYGIIDGVAAGLGRAVVPKHLIRQDDRFCIEKGLEPLKVPIFVSCYENRFPSKLKEQVLTAMVEHSPKLLGC